MVRLRTKIGLGAVAVLGLIQLYRPERVNPPSDPAASFEAVAKPPKEAADVLKRACGDCHSNQTTWPWYSDVAPVSWLVIDDVRGGRRHLNFSEWNLLSPEMAKVRLTKACEEAKEGGMPLSQYTLIHRDAKLSQGDVNTICSLAK